MTKTFTERCKMFEQCLPDASYRDLLKELHTEMLAKLAEQPAQRTWVGLTEYERSSIVNVNTTSDCGYDTWVDGDGVARAIEAKLRETNT